MRTALTFYYTNTVIFLKMIIYCIYSYNIFYKGIYVFIKNYL